jgi:uncharacterized protein (DUF362 family)/Pyruvate/2-oxoacid:ferredoxin oxidoreductase delta subunit
MNNKVSVRKCDKYDLFDVYNLIDEIYQRTEGPDPKGKKVLVKPNILLDTDPSRCVTTHPVVVEAMIRFLQTEGAEVFVGDSPSIHLRDFAPEKSGIKDVYERTGATWIDFKINPLEKNLRKTKIKIASVVDEVDLVISLPKFKNHELVYFTGAIKNTLGLVPGFVKGKQHALYQSRSNFAEFLVDLNEAVLPHYFLMDGIIGMEGPGPGNGMPKKVGVLIGSTNPLIVDIIANSIAGYEPLTVPTTKVAFFRNKWLSSMDDISYDGPALNQLRISSFVKIPVTDDTNISLRFIRKRIKALRKFDRRPVFIHENCTGCLQCVKICPVNAISEHPVKNNYIVLTDKKCIRCFCCSEVCIYDGVRIRRKVFGV